MRLLQVHHALAPPFAEIAQSYAAAAEQNGWEVHTVVLTGDSVEGLAGGLTTLELPRKALSGLKLGALAAFRRALPWRPALIVAHRFKPLYLAALGTSAPVVALAHEFGFCARRTRRLLLRSLGPRVVLGGVSGAVTDELRAVVGRERAVHLPNVLDLAGAGPLLDGDAARAQLLGPTGRSAPRRWVGFVGRLHRKKALPVLLDAFAELRRLPRFADVGLLFVGDGPERATLAARAARLGLDDVVFTGFVPHARRYLRGIDLLVQCSGPVEAFGMTVLEAVWAGTPVVTSDVGGPAELFPGLLPRFASGDPVSLAATLAETLDRPPDMAPAQGELERLYSVRALAGRLAGLAEGLGL